MYGITIENLFDLDYTLAKDYLKKFTYPWEALAGLSEEIYGIGKGLGDDYKTNQKGVWVHVGAKVAPSAIICPPSIICENAEVRHCAFIRGGALVGKSCVVGNSTELKNVILFDFAALPHFNYAGDSIIGYRAHMGAGAITSNVRSDKTEVAVHAGRDFFTGRKKVGSFIGDGAEIGCNSVLNPGAVVGKNSIVYPLSCVRGLVPQRSIFKPSGVISRK